MPSARSRPSEPVDTDSISTILPLSPSFITEPLPKARSICVSAASRARCLSPSSFPTSLSAMLLILVLAILSHDSAIERPTCLELRRGPRSGEDVHVLFSSARPHFEGDYRTRQG